MRTFSRTSEPEARTIALLAGLAVGLGIIIHEIFFLIALAIGAFAATEWAVHRVHEHSHDDHLVHRHS